MDINEKIESNLGLVYRLLHSFNLVNDQDAESLSYEALYDAVKTFNNDAGVAFSTYATCVISNRLRMYIRHINRKRQLQTISYYTPLSIDSDTGYLVDTLHSDDTIEDKVCLKELCSVLPAAFLKVLRELSENQRKVILIWYESDYKASQVDIAKKIGISQAAVSRTISGFRYRLKKELEDYL